MLPVTIRDSQVMIYRMPTDDQYYYDLYIDGVYRGEFTSRENAWKAAELLID